MRAEPNFRKKLEVLVFLASIVIFSGISLVACNSHKEQTSETMTTDSTAITQPIIDTTQAKADWEKFKNDANEKVKDSKDSIAAFKRRVAKFNGKMKIKYEKDVAMLERKNDTLQMKLDNYKDEGKDKWEDFKRGFNHDMDEMKAWLKDSITISK